MGKKLLTALCQAKIVVSLPVRFQILSMGTEDEYSHPWKMVATPLSQATDATVDCFIFLTLALN